MKRLSLLIFIFFSACINRQISNFSYKSIFPQSNSKIIALAFDNNKGSIYYTAGYSNGEISVFNFTDSTPFVKFKAEGKDLLSLIFSDYENSVIAAFKTGSIETCKIYEKKCDNIYSSSETYRFFAFLPASGEYIYQTESFRLDFISPSSGKIIRSFSFPSAITAFSFDNEKKNFIAGLENGEILIWSVMGRGILARANTNSNLPVRLVGEFYYSDLPDGEIQNLNNLSYIPRKTGILALDSSGTFYLFSYSKTKGKQDLQLIKTINSGLDNFYKPVTGINPSNYLAFYNPDGRLRFFSFETITAKYEDKEFEEMTKGIPVQDSGSVNIRLTLPNIKEYFNFDLSIRNISLMTISPDGKYFLVGYKNSDIAIVRNPLILRRFNKLIESADKALASKKCDLAITLYSQAIGLYDDRELEEKRNRAWECKQKMYENRSYNPKKAK